ncbi:MAG: ral stress protein [Planctomycetaceae bacterium]|nr:ral stress protein [Planctomycetaceae bacterium]
MSERNAERPDGLKFAATFSEVPVHHRYFHRKPHRENIMATTSDVKLQELLREFGTAMLVTRTPNGLLRSRPMALADVQPDGTLWLLTDRHSGKLDEIESDHHVNVTAQSSSKFLSLSGTAAPVDDRQKVAELWKESWKVWFPGGKTDPSLVLLRIDGDKGEYWDNSGFGGIKYLIEAGKAYLSGTRPDVSDDPQLHGKVNL